MKQTNSQTNANKRLKLEANPIDRRPRNIPDELQQNSSNNRNFDLSVRARAETSSRDTSQAFIPRPISLANLAQLNGISLVPVDSSHSQPQSVNQTISNQRHQVIITSSSNAQPRHMTNPRSNKQRPSYDIDAIPSIQILNQQFSINQSHGNSGKNRSQSNTKVRNLANSKSGSSMGSQSNSMAGASVNSGNFSLSSINVLPELIASSLSNNHQREDVDMRPNNDLDPAPSYNEFTAGGTDQESMNVSLMRLMAVLNNPALTLTPVGTSSADRRVESNNEVLISSGLGRSKTKVSEIKVEPQSSVDRSCSDFDVHNSRIDRPIFNQSMSKPQSTASVMGTRPSNSSLYESHPPRPDVASLSVSFGQSSNQAEIPLSWLTGSGASNPKETDNSVTLSWVPSRRADNDDADYHDDQSLRHHEEHLEQSEGTSKTVSVEMLHMIAQQGGDLDNLSHNPTINDLQSFVAECSPSNSRVNVQQLDKGARSQEVLFTVYSSGKNLDQKREKHALKGTKDRLFIRERRQPPTNDVDSLPIIHIEASQQKEVLVSERHLMLEKMVEIAETVGHRKQVPVEPDDIFVNRSKRVMSRIDTVLEKKKRKRFERICHRSSPKNTDHENLSDASEDDSMFEENVDLVDAVVVPIQLPLDEVLTEEKRQYLSHVGLISRTDKNSLMLKQCEERLNSISSLILNNSEVVPDDLKRFIDTIVKTGGTEVQMRTETNIKRNELPFIEGLNRNTSRIKMSYMTTLGLDKRSKRTTLYKVTKPNEKKVVKSSNLKQQPQTDLSTQQASNIVKNPATFSQNSAQGILQPERQNSNNHLRIEADLIARVLKLPSSSCREELRVPKDEYMRSLGLMAS